MRARPIALLTTLWQDRARGAEGNMDGESYLYVCAQIGVALSGFSAIATVLRAREQIGAIDKLIVARLVERGLVAAFLALLPILLSGLGLPDRLVWFCASGLLVVYGVVALRMTLRNRSPLRQLVPSWLYYVILVIGAAVIAVQALNALGLGIIAQGAWWHLLGVTWLLVTAGYTFMIFVRAWVRAD
jgi:hypothetical protein